jgi:hypothetical protein
VVFQDRHKALTCLSSAAFQASAGQDKREGFAMTHEDESATKVHYICQTYVEQKRGRDGQASLKIGKQFQYSTASEAQNRAEREAQSEGCAGADAYMVSEDPKSGEVGSPVFLVRLGNVPEFDDF